LNQKKKPKKAQTGFEAADSPINNDTAGRGMTGFGMVGKAVNKKRAEDTG